MSSDHATHASETPTQAGHGGGPLRSIADDASRSDEERALAEMLITWMRQRQAMHGRMIETAAGVRMSIAQVKLLFHLPAEGTMRAGHFATCADLTPAAASQSLDALEHAGVVERVRSESDRRAVDVSLTPLGHRVLDEIRNDFHVRWDAKLAAVDPADLATATRVLDQVIAAFSPAE